MTVCNIDLKANIKIYLSLHKLNWIYKIIFFFPYSIDLNHVLGKAWGLEMVEKLHLYMQIFWY